MEPITLSALILAAAFLAAAVTALSLRKKLAAARAELSAERARPAPPPPPRLVESRRERYAVLWFPTLLVKDDEKLVVSASAGVPHCLRCIRPLKLAADEWTCAGCSDRRPASLADIQATDAVVEDALAEFLFRHEGWRAAPDLKRAPARS